MRHEELEELIPLHALGALDGEDLRAVEAHLQEGCPQCERLLPEFSAIAARLPESLPDVTVSPALKQRILDTIEREDRVQAPSPPSRRRVWLLPLGTAIAAMAAASALFWNSASLRSALERERLSHIEERQMLRQEAEGLRDQLAKGQADMARLQVRLAELQAQRIEGVAALQQRRANEDASALRARLAEQQGDLGRLQAALAEQERKAAEAVKFLRDQLQQERAQLASLQARLAQQEAVLRAVEDPQSRVVSLGGRDPAPQASGKVIWQPLQQTALFYAYRLPPLPSDKTYQLWTIADHPISGGVFGVDQLGNASLRLSAIPRQVKTFAVTIEPAGGLPQPSGAIYLAGSL